MTLGPLVIGNKSVGKKIRCSRCVRYAVIGEGRGEGEDEDKDEVECEYECEDYCEDAQL